MTTKIKKKWIILAAVVIFLIAGNPTRQQMKSRFGLVRESDGDIRRKYNFLIFSIWEYDAGHYAHDGVYLGCLFNFFKIGGSEYL